MYEPNQMNSLYFYPHKLHFSPQPDAADTEQRNRWLPGHTTTAKPVNIPAIDSDTHRPAADDVRADDSDAAPTKGGHA